MKNEREENIDKLIKESGLERSPDGLKKSIMSEIRKYEVAKENAMYALLQSKASESPSDNFTNQLMAKLPKEAETTSFNIFGKYGWAAIIVAFLTLVCVVVIGGVGQESSENSVQLSETVNNGVSSFLDLVSVGPIFIFCVLAVGLLGTIDFISSRIKS
jgi:hypothetical protein